MGFHAAKTVKPNPQLSNKTIEGYYVGNGVSIKDEAFPIIVDQFHPSTEPMKVKVKFDEVGVGIVEIDE